MLRYPTLRHENVIPGNDVTGNRQTVSNGVLMCYWFHEPPTRTVLRT